MLKAKQKSGGLPQNNLSNVKPELGVNHFKGTKTGNKLFSSKDNS